MAAAQLPQGRVDEQVADQRGRDGHAQHGVEVLGRVAAGDLLGQDDHDRGDDAAEHVDAHRRAEPGVDHAEHPGARPVVAGHGERPVRAHDPGRAGGQQAQDEQEGAAVAEDQAGPAEGGRAVGGDVAAVHGEDGLDGADEPAEVGDGAGRQHDQDADHGQRVEHDAGHAGAGDGERHVALRVGHLLARAVGQLEADEVEQQHAHQEHEPAGRRRVAARAQAVGAVLGRVEDDREGEQAEQDEPGEGPGRGQPLAHAEGRDGGHDGQPDERQRDDVEHRSGHGVALVEEHLDGADAGNGQRAADPHRVGDPVQEVVHRPGQVPEGQPGPVVGTALLREGGAELGEQQGLRHEEDDREDHHPGEGLAAALRDRGDRVHADDGADEEEQDVEAAEVPLQLLSLDIGDGQRVQGGHSGRSSHARQATSSHPMMSGVLPN